MQVSERMANASGIFLTPTAQRETQAGEAALVGFWVYASALRSATINVGASELLAAEQEPVALPASCQAAAPQR